MKKLLKRTLLPATAALVLTTAAAAAESSYTDVPEDAWYADAVAYCREHALMDDGKQTRFYPESPMTRGMLAESLYRMAGSPAAEGESPFPDVPDGSQYAGAVVWNSRNNYMNGYDSGLFGPEDHMTREQLAAVLWRRAGCPLAEAEDYADEADISAFAAAAVDWARSIGMMNGIGDNTFAPQEGATRAQMAKVLVGYAATTAIQVSAMDVMSQPCGLAAMEDGSLLVCDGYNKVIWRVADGKSAVYAGAGTVEDPFGQPVGGYHDGSLEESLFKTPWAIAPFLGGWAVSDAGNGVVRFLRPDGASDAHETAVTDLGLQFQRPTGLAADEQGNLYVADTLAGAIQRITPDGTVTVLASGLEEPMGLCWHGGSLYAAECGADRIIRIDQSGRVAAVSGGRGSGNADGPAAEASFSGPKGVAVTEDGTIYVADTDNGCLRKIQDGQVTTVLSRDPWDTEALFPVAPTGLLVQGNTLYISDMFARKLLAFPLA